MKRRGIGFAFLCVMSVLLALAPLGCAEENVDGGLFAVFYDDSFLSFACKLSDDTLGTYNSDILKKLAQIGTKVEVVDLETKKSYTGTLSKSTVSLALIGCGEALDGESLTFPTKLEDGGTCEGAGYMMKEDAIVIGRITVKRPGGSSMEGTYEGGELLAGSPIYLEQNGKILTLGFAGDDSSSYVDVSAFFKAMQKVADGKQTGGQVSSKRTSNGANYEKWLVYLLTGGAFLALVILANVKRGKKDVPSAQPAKPDANVTMPLMDDENVTVPDDPRYRGGASGSVVLECTGGALRGASFPITGRVVLGRDPSRCVIVYPRDEKGVSAVHCAVEPVADDAVLVTDLGSSYGTLAGSKPLTSGMSARVRAGERIVLGGSGNEFQVRTR